MFLSDYFAYTLIYLNISNISVNVLMNLSKIKIKKGFFKK